MGKIFGLNKSELKDLDNLMAKMIKEESLSKIETNKAKSLLERIKKHKDVSRGK